MKEPIEPGQPDLSPIILITEVHVAPGEAPAFLKLIHIVEYQQLVKRQLVAYQTVADGDPDRLFIIQHLRNFAELEAANSIRSAVPAGKREMFDDALAKCVRSSYVKVMRYRQDLSAVAR